MKKTNTLILSLLTAASFTSVVQAQTLVPKWSKTSDITLGSGNNGLGYSPVTHNVIASVCASGTAGNATIYRIKASDGTVLTPNLTVNTTISGGTYVIGGLAVGSDGAIYACNYGAAGATKLYKWADESSSPVQLGPTFTVGAGSIGKNLAVYGTGNNAVFLLTSTTTGPIYVYYDTSSSTWKAKALSVGSGSCQTTLSFVNWSSTSCTFVSKNSAASGYKNVFDPSAASPTVTQSGISGWASGNGTIQNVAYDPTSTLLGTFTRNLNASPYTITVNTWATGKPSGTLTAPVAQTAQTANATAFDSGAAGACCWGEGMYFCMPAVAGFGLRAYDVTAFKVADTSPASASKNPGESATFSVVSGGSQLTYQWKKDGTDISDATTASLTLAPVSLADAGSYTCTVSGVSGSSWTSSAGVLYLLQDTTTALSSSTGTSTYGEAVTFTATVSAATGTPTGTVTFKAGTATLGTAPLSAAGTAEFTTSTLSAVASPHSITAAYSGTPAYNASTSDAVTQTVAPQTLVPSVTVGNKAYDGTLAAVITGRSLAGVVDTDDVTLEGSGATAFPDVNVGSYSLTVTGLALSGTTAGNYVLSTDTVTATADITPAGSTLALLSSLNPSTNGDSVTFTATVSSSAGTPTGNVVFLTNGVALATVTLSSGTATATTANLPVGTTTVLAQYAAQDNWQASANSLAQEVRSAVTLSTTNTVLSIVADGGGVFTLNCLGTPGAQYYVVAGSDITAPVSGWTALAGSTNTAATPSGLWSFQVSNSAPAFYRAVAIHPAP